MTSALAYQNFFTSLGHFVPKSGVGRGTEAFIYALSADKTSPAFAAPRHAITALLSCRFKCPCPPRRQPHFRSNADRAYNTLHFASKVVCQRESPFGNPGQQNRLNTSHFSCAWCSALICCQQPVSRSAFLLLSIMFRSKPPKSLGFWWRGSKSNYNHDQTGNGKDIRVAEMLLGCLFIFAHSIFVITYITIITEIKGRTGDEAKILCCTKRSKTSAYD